MTGRRVAGPIRLIVVDNSARMRHALRAILACASDIVVVGEAADGRSAIVAVERDRPDVVLMDVHMSGMDGLEATRHLKQRWPALRVLILSVDTEVDHSALMAGADAVLLKGDPEEVLLAEIRGSAR